MFDISQRVKDILASGPGKPEKIKMTKEESDFVKTFGKFPSRKELEQFLSNRITAFGISDEEREKRAERLRKKNETQN